MKSITFLIIFNAIFIIGTYQLSIKKRTQTSQILTDCEEIFSNSQNDLIECLAYKLVLDNSEKFHDDVDTLSHLQKPILTKPYENKTVAPGDNVTFTCETPIDSYPIFLFYKLNLMHHNKTVLALQDKEAFNDYTSISPNILIRRNEHLEDSNTDTKSDLETVGLTILNANSNDIGIYMCIIANSLKSYRLTYAHLNVVQATVSVGGVITPIQNDANAAVMIMNEVDHFFTNNKASFIITAFLIFAIVLVLVFIGYIGNKYRKAKMKNRLAKSPSSQMNSLIEKTINSMKKNFVYVTMPNGTNSVSSTLSHNFSLDQNALTTTTMTTTNELLKKQHDYYNNINIFPNQNASEFVDDSASASWEFQREKLKLGRLIDEGAFGRVYLAEAFGIIPGRYKSVVAVKMIKENATKVELTDFIKELNIMKNVGKHDNIISLLGCCSKSGPLYAIVEYAKFGNLRNYLRTRRPKDYMISTSDDTTTTTTTSTNQESDLEDSSTLGYNIRKLYSTINKKKIESTTAQSAKDELMVELLKFCVQIANGMKYLHSKKVCHRDLAARNILLDEFKTAKIADFGLARDLQHTYYYKRKSESKLPVRWMSPETLFDHKVYPNSDIWSFGVLMWEIFTLGGNPYPTVPVENLFDYLKEGNRMSKPMYCDDELYKIMLDCWTFKSDKRPSFDMLYTRLQSIHEKYENKLKENNLDLNFKNFMSNIELKKQLGVTQPLLLTTNAGTLTSSSCAPSTITSVSSSLTGAAPRCSAHHLLSTNNNNEKRLTRQSESDDSQYFSGTDISNSLLYVDSSNVSSSASSHYSPYIVPNTIMPSIMHCQQFSQAPPSPPPPKTATTLLNLASAAYNL